MVTLAAGALLAVGLFAILSPGNVGATDPELVNGNPTCVDLGYQYGFKIEKDGEGVPPLGTYTLQTGTQNGAKTELSGGAPTDLTNSITITKTGKYISWTSTFGIDAVIVKGGPAAYVYKYNPEGTSGTDQRAPDNNGGQVPDISHVTFCYDVDPLKKLEVDKTVEATADKTYSWTIKKSVQPAEWHVFDGDSVTSEYTVQVDKGNWTAGNYRVSGTITIKNPNNVPVKVTGITDNVDGTTATITGCTLDGADIGLPPFDIPGKKTVNCDYEATAADGLDGGEKWNKVTVEAEKNLGNDKRINFTYAYTTIDGEVTVTDTNDAFNGPKQTNRDKTWTYSVTFPCVNVQYDDNGVATLTFPNTATISGANGVIDSDDASVTVYCYRLDVEKTVDTSYDRRFEWTITKIADPTTHNLLVGESASSDYTIEVTKSDPIDENFAVSGTITIENPNPQRAAVLTSVTDVISDGLAADVNCPSLTVAAGGSLECSYSRDLPNGDARINRATATLQNYAFDKTGSGTEAGSTPYSVTEDVTFGDPVTVTLNEITVDDTNIAGTPDFGPTAISTTFEYPVSFTCTADDLNGQASVTLEYPNTATIVETKQSDDATVIVNCAEQDALVVSKTVNLSFDRTWEWDIVKSVDPAVHDLLVGEEGVSNYTIEVTKRGPVDSNWHILGSISITNPATVPATITGVADVVTQTGLGDTNATILGCTVDGNDVGIPSAGAPVTLDPGATMSCSYEADLPGGANGTNLATVTTTGEVPGATGAADVDFATATIDESLTQVTVDDSYDGAPDPWIFTDSDAVGYERTFTCADVDFGGSTTVSYTAENVATIRETGANDDADVTVNCTRTADPGQIIIRKDATPDGSPWVFQFDGPGSLGDGLLDGEFNIETLAPGSYTISEDLDELGDRWLLTDIVCESASGASDFDVNLANGSVTIDLAEGDTVDCTFFNQAQPGVVIPEAPLAVLFPLIGLLVGLGGFFIWRRQHAGAAS